MKRAIRFTKRTLAVMLAGVLAFGTIKVPVFAAEDLEGTSEIQMEATSDENTQGTTEAEETDAGKTENESAYAADNDTSAEEATNTQEIEENTDVAEGPASENVNNEDTESQEETLGQISSGTEETDDGPEQHTDAQGEQDVNDYMEAGESQEVEEDSTGSSYNSQESAASSDAAEEIPEPGELAEEVVTAGEEEQAVEEVTASTSDQVSNEIYTVNDLKNVSSSLDGSYILMNDLNLGNEEWTPIGTPSDPFAGTFYGNGHTISGLKIDNDSNYQGLFGKTLGATISKLTVNGSVSGSQFIAGIAGEGEDSTFTYCINNASVNGADQVGGVVGRQTRSEIEYCMNTGSVTASGRGCGGVSADIYPSGSIANCLNTGSISGGTDITGGIVGGSTSGNVSGCVNAAEVTYQKGRAGAIAGDNAGYAGTRNDNYFLQNAGINENFGAIGDGSGTFSSATDEIVITLKNIILSGNGMAEETISALIDIEDKYVLYKNQSQEVVVSSNVHSKNVSPNASNMSWQFGAHSGTSVTPGAFSVVGGPADFIASYSATYTGAGDYDIKTILYNNGSMEKKLAEASAVLHILDLHAVGSPHVTDNVRKVSIAWTKVEDAEEYELKFTRVRTNEAGKKTTYNFDPIMTSETQYTLNTAGVLAGDVFQVTIVPVAHELKGASATINDIYVQDDLEACKNELIEAMDDFLTAMKEEADNQRSAESPEEMKEQNISSIASGARSANMIATAMGTTDAELSAIYQGYSKFIVDHFTEYVKMENVDLSGNWTQIESAFIEFVQNNLRHEEETYEINGYTVMVETTDWGGAFTGHVTLKKNGIQKQIADITSVTDSVQQLMTKFSKNMQEIMEAAMYDALTSVVDEIGDKTGIKDWTEAKAKKAFNDVLAQLRSKGFGDILDNIQKMCNIYKAANSVMDILKASSVADANKKAKSCYETLNKIEITTATAEYSTMTAPIKKAFDKVFDKKKALEKALQYMYGSGWTSDGEEDTQTIEVNKIGLNKTSATLATTKTLKLTATVKPTNATDKSVIWTSSDSSVATVSSSGLVKALKYGKATITAKSSNGMIATCKIQTRFNDVNNAGKSYYTPVYWAVDKGITVCTVTFRPDDSVTRGEFVAFLWRLAGKPKLSAKVSFKDVTSSTKFYDAIRWAVGKGIINGYSDGTFKSDNPVTRGETATMIWRYAGKKTPKTKTSPFSDIKASSADSYKAILWGSENGIIKGSGGKFLKNDTCTRGQVVTFLYRYKQKY